MGKQIVRSAVLFFGVWCAAGAVITAGATGVLLATLSGLLIGGFVASGDTK
jgi:hypothetical protein